MTTIRARFHPEEWVGDYAIPVDPEGPTDFTIPLADIADLDLEDPYDRDQLRTHQNAPEWVQEWSGPFEVEVLT